MIIEKNISVYNQEEIKEKYDKINLTKLVIRGGVRMEVINIGMLGLGTVGSGVVRMLTDHAEKISLITGRKLVVKTVVVHDLTKKR